eukprot:Selendium_serpulae@DN6311_c1_g6_i1.p1
MDDTRLLLPHHVPMDGEIECEVGFGNRCDTARRVIASDDPPGLRRMKENCKSLARQLAGQLVNRSVGRFVLNDSPWDAPPPTDAPNASRSNSRRRRAEIFENAQHVPSCQIAARRTGVAIYGRLEEGRDRSNEQGTSLNKKYFM